MRLMAKITEQQKRAIWETLLRTVSALLRDYETEMEESQGLALSWYDVLVQLSVSPDGRLRMQALADSVALTRSGLTRLVDRMEQAGLIRRDHSPEDRRGYYATITEEGLEVFQRARPVHRRGIQEHFTRHLDDADFHALRDLLDKVREGNRLPTGDRH